MSEQIVLDELIVEVTRKNIRNMHLRVYPPDGQARITAPFRMGPEKIRGFALSKLEWIKRQQKRIREGGWTAPPAYQDGESHFVWGKAYPLQVVEGAGKSPFGGQPPVELLEDRLVLRVRKGAGPRKKKALVDGWHRARVGDAIPPLVAKWEPRVGVKVMGFFVRHMKTRWGTCHTRKGTIRLNAALAQKPFDCLEYVVVHEMVHLLEPSHNARFKALMGKFMPQWKSYRKQLRTVDPNCL
jgi:predicted metal-dependent hydrolase